MMAEQRNEGEDTDAGEGRFEGQDIRHLRILFERELRATEGRVLERVSPQDYIQDLANGSWTSWRTYSIDFWMFNKMRIDNSIHMKEDHHMTITVNDLETMIAIMTVTMTISVIHLVLVFDDLSLPVLDRYLYRITGTWLVRETLLSDLLSISSRKRLEVLGQD